MSPIKVIRIPAEKVLKEYEWLGAFQSESYLYAYIVNHAQELFGEGTKLAGLEIIIPEAGRVDSIFRRGGDYLVVEAKHTDEKAAKEEAERYAEKIRAHIISHGQVIPIGVVMRYPRGENRLRQIRPGGIVPQLLKSRPVLHHRQHIDYEYTAKALKDGSFDVFFSGIRRQTAHQAAKKLSGMVGEEVFAFPMKNGGEHGYGMIRQSRLKETKDRLDA